MRSDLEVNYFYGYETERIGVDNASHGRSNKYHISKLKDNEFTEKQDLDFVSDEIKIFVNGQISYFHMIMESISNILYLHDIFKKDAFFVIDLFGDAEDYEILKQDESTKIYPKNYTVKLLIDFLEKFNIKYKFINTNIQNIIANNYYAIQSVKGFETNIKNLNKYSLEGFSKNLQTIPFRKVYMSRSHMYESEHDFINNDFKKVPSVFGNYFNNPCRMDNEKKLEKFLHENYGFEIINPEIMFDNIEEQIRYMSTVKTIASITSSGLTNMVFMQPYGQIFEFATPLSAGHMEDYHTHYQNMGIALEHDYYCIPHVRYANDIISSIGDNKILDHALRR
jgi:hypothetical protein